MPPPDQLPATVPSGALATPADTSIVVPALIADLGDQANWRYVEFFTANINNDHTRRAYARACSRFFAWCENRGLSLTSIRPFDVAAWVKELQETHGAPGVKQQLAAVRMLFDWLITGQIVPMNPAAAVRGPKHVVKTGKTPVLEGDEWRKLLASIPTTTLRDLRDRALIATLTYSFARISAALKMKVEDLNVCYGNFQAIKHALADLHVAVTLAEHAVLYASYAVDAKLDGADLAVAVAKAKASDAAVAATAAMIQYHGGIGYTWEHEAHFFYKRARRRAPLFGSAEEHREHLAALTMSR